MKNRPPQMLDKYVTKVGLYGQLAEHPGRSSKENLSFPQRFHTFPMRILLHLILFHGLCFAAMGAQPADHTTSSKAEVFVTGPTKPGTTSLGDTLEMVNCIRSGWLDIWSQYLSHQAPLPTPNLRSLTPMPEEYVAFEPFPWCLPQVYTKMSRKCPDAKFILSLNRTNTCGWRECQSIPKPNYGRPGRAIKLSMAATK
jgi:hypothetical protein